MASTAWALHAQLGRPALPDIESQDVGKEVAEVLDKA
jgi:hypothetical protein